MAKCLVLGANGFIGSHLVDSLADSGHTVRAFDRFGGKVVFNNHASIDKISGDFLNRSDLLEAINGVEYVFHFISTTTPATAEDDPLIDIDTNIRMSVELFRLCAENGVKRVIFASTGGAIYGTDNYKPHSETDVPLPISPYAIGKLTIEHYLRYFRVKYGLDSLVLRISNPYGERQPLHRKQGVIPIFIENICQDLPITVLGDGSMVRDYIYVKDVAAMITRIFYQKIQHHTYNLGSGCGVSLTELVSVIEKVTGLKPNIIHKTAPSTFVNKVVLDTSRLCSEFSIIPKTELDTGIESTYKYIAAEISRHENGKIKV